MSSSIGRSAQFRRVPGIFSIVLIAVLVGMVGLHLLKPSHAASCTVSSTLVNSCRPWFGAWSNTYPQAAKGLQGQTEYFEQRIGRQVDTVHDYLRPGDTLTANDKYFINRPNTILQLNWKPADNFADANGGNATVNTQIDNMARSIKAMGPHRIILGIYHEPEDNVTTGSAGSCHTNPNGHSGSPADYRAMWQNVRHRFDAQGVNNVAWALILQGYSGWDCLMPQMWPGNSYVDWILYDPYDFANNNGTWDGTISPFYNWMTANSDANHDYLSKAWGLAEYGIGRNVSQATTYRFYDQAKADLDASKYPRLKLYQIFDAIGPNNNGGTDDLRISYDDSGAADPTELAHFKSFAQDPRFTDAYYVSGSGGQTGGSSGGGGGGGTTAPALPDLTITGLSATPANPAAGQSVTFSATVKNQGTAAMPSGKAAGVSWVINGTKLSWNSVSNLASGASYTVSGTHAIAGTNGPNWTAVAGTASLSATIDDTGQISESNESNNSAATTFSVAASPTAQGPKAPTGLNSPSQTTTSISLRWTASSDPDTPANQLIYHVKRDGQPLGQTAVGVTGFTDSGLAPASSHSYVVTASDPQGNSSPASVALAATTKSLNCPAPAAPAGFTAAGVSATSATLKWAAVGATPPCAINHYVVLRGTTAIAQISGTSFNATGLLPASGYDFHVLAVTSDNHAGATADLHLTTPTAADTTPPSAPAGLAASAVTTSQINLSWSASSDSESSIRRYYIVRGGQAIGSTTSTSFGDTGLSPNTHYVYTIVAENGAGLKATSAAVAVTTPAAPVTPTVPVAGGGAKQGVPVSTTATMYVAPIIPVLKGTVSVGTASDATSDKQSATSHSYNTSADKPVSDDPAASLVSATASRTPDTSNKQQAAQLSPSTRTLSMPFRLTAGLGGSLLIAGVPLILLRLWRPRRLTMQPAASIDRDLLYSPAAASPSAWSEPQIIRPTTPPANQTDKEQQP